MAVDAAEYGLTVVKMLQDGEFAALHERFAPGLRGLVSVEQLGAAWSAGLAQAGPVVDIGTPIVEAARPGATTVKIPVICRAGGFAVVLSTDAAAQLWGLQLLPLSKATPTPPWTAPDYATPDTFAEQEITLGTGTLTVSGTLSMPRRPGPLPAVVFLAGSGPQDRDETLGAGKPLKDLAWGLATAGIATLRFDKVTHANPAAFLQTRDYTVLDEYFDHAIAAIRSARQHPDIDPARVFLAGHSLGATVAPRVAAAEPGVAGLILLAAGTQPLHHTLVRQLRYLASLRPGADVDADPGVQTAVRQAALIDSPAFSAATPAEQLPFGVPASYWLDLLSYDPVATAAQLDLPTLLLQGSRDYQVTVADDLPAWESGLADGTDVTLHIYEADNHSFFPGTGPSSPAEYEGLHHVDPLVVANLAAWIAEH
jgi:dienelactone hydrolase